MDDNLVAPDFGPTLPLYPELPQIIRVTGLPFTGTNIFPGYTQQYTGSLSFRDRERCALIEPNGITLAPGYYDARLVGWYAPSSLPLYATTCCPGNIPTPLTTHLAPGGIMRRLY